MGNMGMAENEYHEKMLELGSAPMSDSQAAYLRAVEMRVVELEQMVHELHQGLAAIGGGPCICDVCKTVRSRQPS